MKKNLFLILSACIDHGITNIQLNEYIHRELFPIIFTSTRAERRELEAVTRSAIRLYKSLSPQDT